MNAAEQYTARSDAVGEQRTRVLHVDPQYRDRWTGALAKRFRVDPRRDLDSVLAFIVEQVRPDDVFLDVGGGAGRVALPIALRCREAIVVDPSEGMHHEFDELVAESGITNARYVEAPWPSPEAKGIEGDVVFASHVTYFVREIRPFVEAMHEAARRRVMILVGSVPPPASNARLFRLVHGENQMLVPGHQDLLPVLWDMGLVPEVRVLGAGAFAVMNEPVKDRDEAIQAALISVEVAGQPEAWAIVEQHFDELFRSTPDGYVATWRPESRTVIITWAKEP